MKRVRFHRLAETELLEATAYYEAERLGLGGEFLDELDRSLGFALRFPLAAPAIRSNIRRLVIPRFPYSILYRPLPAGGLRVLAIAHHKRRPEYWVGRR